MFNASLPLSSRRYSRYYSGSLGVGSRSSTKSLTEPVVRVKLRSKMVRSIWSGVALANIPRSRDGNTRIVGFRIMGISE